MDNFNYKKYLAEGRLFKENSEIEDSNQLSLFPGYQQYTTDDPELEKLFMKYTSQERIEWLRNTVKMPEDLINSPEIQDAIKYGELNTIMDIVDKRYEDYISQGKSNYINLIKSLVQKFSSNPEVKSLIKSIETTKNPKIKSKLKRELAKIIKPQLDSDQQYYGDVTSMLRTGELLDGFHVKRDQFGRLR
jgi:hypothetical protein